MNLNMVAVLWAVLILLMVTKTPKWYKKLGLINLYGCFSLPFTICATFMTWILNSFILIYLHSHSNPDTFLVLVTTCNIDMLPVVVIKMESINSFCVSAIQKRYINSELVANTPKKIKHNWSILNGLSFGLKPIEANRFWTVSKIFIVSL